MDKATYALLSGKINNITENVDQIATEATEAWLEDNVDPDTGYVLDRTLTMSNAAAPADLVGAQSEKIDDINRVFGGKLPSNAIIEDGYYNDSAVLTPLADTKTIKIPLYNGVVILKFDKAWFNTVAMKFKMRIVNSDGILSYKKAYRSGWKEIADILDNAAWNGGAWIRFASLDLTKNPYLCIAINSAYVNDMVIITKENIDDIANGKIKQDNIDLFHALPSAKTILSNDRKIGSGYTNLSNDGISPFGSGYLTYGYYKVSTGDVISVLSDMTGLSTYGCIVDTNGAATGLSATTDLEYTVASDGYLILSCPDNAVITITKAEDKNIIPLSAIDIKVVAGAIRNAGDGWEFIDDSAHSPLNCSSVSVDNNGDINIEFSFTANEIFSFVISPDETFAQNYTIGASVGDEKAVCTIYQNGVKVDASTVSSQYGNFWFIGIFK